MSRSSSTEHRERLAFAAALALLVAALFGRALGYDFVYDDRVLIEGNDALGDWGTLGVALSHDLFHFAEVRASPYWRPLVVLSYYVDHAIGGGAPWAFHLDNLVALVFAGTGLFALLRRHVAVPEAALGALLFVVHPLLVEATVNIASRTDLYCAGLAFWALTVKDPRAGGALALLACFSKEPAVFLALVALAIDRRDARWKWMALSALVFLALRGLVVDVAPDATLAGAFDSGGRALWLFSRPLLPIPLAPAFSGVDAFGRLGWIPLLLLVGAGVWKLRGLRAGGAVLIGAAILPVSGLLQSTPRYGDGLLVLAVAGFVLVFGKLPRWSAVALVPFVVLGQLQVGQWQDERSLWETAHRRLPDDANIRLNLARTVVEEDPARAAELVAVAHFSQDRQQRELEALRARAALLQGQTEAALEYATKAAGDDQESLWANSVVCVQGGGGAAYEACQRALTWAPQDADLHNAAGIHAPDARARADAFRRACDLSPDKGPYCSNAQRSELELGPGIDDEGP